MGGALGSLGFGAAATSLVGTEGDGVGEGTEAGDAVSCGGDATGTAGLAPTAAGGSGVGGNGEGGEQPPARMTKPKRTAQTLVREFIPRV